METRTGRKMKERNHNKRRSDWTSSENEETVGGRQWIGERFCVVVWLM